MNDTRHSSVRAEWLVALDESLEGFSSGTTCYGRLVQCRDGAEEPVPNWSGTASCVGSRDFTDDGLRNFGLAERPDRLAWPPASPAAG